MTVVPGSRVWTSVFRILFLVSPAGPVRAVRRVVPVGQVEEVLIVGRRSGSERRSLLALFEVDGTWYVGHPNGLRAHWVRNLLAAGSAVVVKRDGSRTSVRAVSMPDGPQRDAVIRAMPRQQPFPVNVIYRAGRGHIRSVGHIFRLEPERDPARQ